MNAIYQPVLHMASRRWMLGVINDNLARPLEREEIEIVILNLTHLETFKEGLHQAKFEYQSLRADLNAEQIKCDQLRTENEKLKQTIEKLTIEAQNSELRALRVSVVPTDPVR